MPGDKSSLTKLLRGAGLSQSAIDAAWPTWWTDRAEQTLSGRAELRFALARRLGLQPKPLLGERVEFIWDDSARFKHLTTEQASQKAALTSFGVSIGRLLLRATHGATPTDWPSAEALRGAILGQNNFVDLQSLISTCWALGVPVIHLRVFPLDTKGMHAMVVADGGRYAVLLGRDALYPASIAFTLAHELGHIVLGHLGDSPALVDLEDPAVSDERDNDEEQADAFALTLLTGSSNPDIKTNLDTFNAATLARAVIQAAHQYRIEPGTLALCLAYRRNVWAVANASLRYIYAEAKPVADEVNGIALRQLHWDALGDDGAVYLQSVMGHQ